MRVTGLTHASGMFMFIHGHRERVSSTQESTIQTGIKYNYALLF